VMLFCSLPHIQRVQGVTQSSQSQETPRRVLFASNRQLIPILKGGLQDGIM